MPGYNVNVTAWSEPDEPLRSTLRARFRADREWLVAHPDDDLVRQYVDGEFWPNEPDVEEVEGRVLRVYLSWFLGDGRGPVRVRELADDPQWAITDPEDAVNWLVRS